MTEFESTSNSVFDGTVGTLSYRADSVDESGDSLEFIVAWFVAHCTQHSRAQGKYGHSTAALQDTM
jgi:hypothetical protein